MKIGTTVALDISFYFYIASNKNKMPEYMSSNTKTSLKIFLKGNKIYF
jgi:hypothetical protein